MTNQMMGNAAALTRLVAETLKRAGGEPEGLLAVAGCILATYAHAAEMPLAEVCGQASAMAIEFHEAAAKGMDDSVGEDPSDDTR